MVGMRDASDFDTFYHATARRVLYNVYVVCGDLAEAQDIVLEAYARA
jgi:RNA polymerase sigma-70 factor, ECF subfamily